MTARAGFRPSPSPVSVEKNTTWTAASLFVRSVQPEFEPAACVRTSAASPENAIAVEPDAAIVNPVVALAAPMLSDVA